MSVGSGAGLTVFGGRLLLDSGPVEGVLTAIDGTLTALGPTVTGDPAPPDHATIDASGLLVAPGFIDLQVNGGHGIDLATDPHALWALGAQLPASGVTAFLPTIVSSPDHVVDAAIAAMKARPKGYRGAEPIGLHLEGPMLSLHRRGAHRAANLRPAEPALVKGWRPTRGVVLVTLAPELPGADDVIRTLREAGVVVSGGHSDASGAQTSSAAALGMTMVTHLFNAMSPLDHREPGMAGVALTDDRLAAGLIADGIHVDPAVVKLAWLAKGPEKLVLVTDAVAAMGLGAESHRLGDRLIVSDHTGVRTEDGTLAGSKLTMDAAVRNLIRFTGAGIEAAIVSATTAPALAINDRTRGSLQPGLRADLVLLTGANRPAICVCAGQVVYASPAETWRIGRST